jgi:omega-6 fatty acid desaturase (delta-12 desaturase)
MRDLLGAIPKHCFERSAIRSSAYIVMDFAFLAVLAYTATFINSFLGYRGSIVDGMPGQALRAVAWFAYAFAASLPGTGIWIIACV